MVNNILSNLGLSRMVPPEMRKAVMMLSFPGRAVTHCRVRPVRRLARWRL
jgi:hypothetical protein